MTTLSVPPRYLLVSTYEIRRREELCVILIKISNEVFNKFSPMSLMARTFTSYIYLMAPLNMPPQNIKTVSIHIGLAKSRSSPVILLRDSIPQDGPASKFEILDRIIILDHLIISPLVVPFSTCFTNCWEV